MKRYLVYALIALIAGAGMSAAQSSRLKTLGKDYEARGWEAVGRLDLGGGFCTATLIAPNLVLSAAQCVYDRRGKLIPAARITFNAGLRNGRAAATRTVAKVAAPPGFDPLGPLTLENVRHDLALLELAEPIPTSEIDPFVLHGESVRPGAVSVVSYGRGRSEAQSRQKSCGLTERHGDLLVFNCDVTFGSSGAPVFSHLNGRGRILSVISSKVPTYKGQRVALGPHLPPLVGELKRALRAQSQGPAATIRRITVGGGARAGGAKFVKVD